MSRPTDPLMATTPETAKRRYAAKTVLSAQRRVLTLTLGYIRAMPKRQREVLRTDGAGLMTLDEVAEHIDAALNLKVKR